MSGKSEAAGHSKRGKNWTEADSLKLIDAYQHVQSVKRGILPRITTFTFLIHLDGDNSGIINDKIAAEFAAASPEVEGRSTDAIRERLKKLTETYRYFCDGQQAD